MKRKGESFGQSVVNNLREFSEVLKAGKPFKQTVRRRMIVKGKTVYTRETFTAPAK